MSFCVVWHISSIIIPLSYSIPVPSKKSAFGLTPVATITMSASKTSPFENATPVTFLLLSNTISCIDALG